MIRLMKNTFYHEEETKKKLCEFILNSERLSMGPKCKEFEEKFSEKQGRKYSVLFNSGSSANLALIQALLNIGTLNKGDYVGFSSLTWSTNVMPLIQLGLNPVPIDVSLKNLNVTSEFLDERIEEISVLFLTNLLGFCGDIDKIKEMCSERQIILLEDNCESLGSEVKGKKLGNMGLASTFSFFVGHHLSTVEGGMVCTNDEGLYDMLKMVRAHGWSRDIGRAKKEQLKINHNIKDFYDSYTFYSLGYNLRPTEITGFIGLEQLKYWDEICKKREENFKNYEKVVKQNENFQELDFSHMGLVSNFAYPIICKDKGLLHEYQKILSEKMEIRPLVGGSIIKQPFFKTNGYECPNAEKIHELGFYIPNNQDLTEDEIKEMCDLLK